MSELDPELRYRTVPDADGGAVIEERLDDGTWVEEGFDSDAEQAEKTVQWLQGLWDREETDESEVWHRERRAYLAGLREGHDASR